MDACDRLAQLNLNDVQQREIIRVLLHCCGNVRTFNPLSFFYFTTPCLTNSTILQEKSYNPYYALIGQHLCRQTHSHRITLQFCFWDFLRSLGETGVGGAEMAESFRDEDNDDQGFELDRISSTRAANVARLYAWWVSRELIAITILKV